jgi:hypothetical protein
MRFIINDDERGLHQDYDDWLEDVRSKLRLVPRHKSFDMLLPCVVNWGQVY